MHPFFAHPLTAAVHPGRRAFRRWRPASSRSRVRCLPYSGPYRSELMASIIIYDIIGVMKRAPFAGKVGRPPAGNAGEPIANYPRLTLRLPPATLAKLKAWAKVSGRPAWRLIAESIEAAVGRLEGTDAEDVRRLAKREASRLGAE